MVALAEAVTFLLLLVATYFKYTADSPGAVSLLGPIHGTFFLVYVAGALMVRRRLDWSISQTLAVLGGAVLPFGGFVVDRWILDRETAGQVSDSRRPS